MASGSQNTSISISLRDLKSNQTMFLSNDAIGWEDFKIILERDMDTYGILKYFDGELTFFNESAIFIKNAFEKDFIEANIEISFSVERPDLVEPYLIGVGSLNLSEIKKFKHLQNRELAIEEKDFFTRVSCKIDMLGFSQDIQNNSEKLFNINTQESVNGNTLLTYPSDKLGFELPFHSKTLLLEAILSGVGEIDFLEGWNPVHIAYSYNIQLDNLELDEFVDTVSTTPSILSDSFNTTNANNDNEVDDVPNEYQELFEIFTPNTNQVYLFHITGLIQFVCNSGDSVERHLQFYFWDSRTKQVVLIEDLQLDGSGIVNRDINFSKSLFLEPKDKVKVWVRVINVTTGITLKMLHDISIRISSNSVFDGSKARSYMIYETIDKALSFITGENNSLYSIMFGRTDSFPNSYGSESSPAFAALTNGSLLRNFENYQDVTFTWKELIQSLQAIWNIGAGTEVSYDAEGNIVKKLRIEFIDYFFKKNLNLFFENPDDIELIVANDLIHSKIKIGYDKFESDFKSTTDEAFTTREYNTHLTKTTKGIDISSKLVASPYAIENARRQSFSVKPSESFKYDNDNFIIQLKRGEFKINIISTEEDFGNDYILIRSGSAIKNEEYFNSFQIVQIEIFESISNNGVYSVISYSEQNSLVGGNQKIKLNSFVSNSSEITQNSYAIVRTNLSKFFVEQDQDFETENLSDPSTSINLRITPVRNLMRWFRILKTSFHKAPLSKMKFVRGVQNYALKTQIINSLNDEVEDSGLIKENEDFIAENNKQSLINPFYISYSHPLSFSKFLEVETRKYELLSVTTDKNKSKHIGYLKKVTYDFWNQKADFIIIPESTAIPSSPVEPDEPVTLPISLKCDEIVKGGGKGRRVIKILLDASQESIHFALNSYSIATNFEIWHNGIKVATSGMSVSNDGPFKNDSIQDASQNQYIGTIKGVIPTRESEFEVENGFNPYLNGFTTDWQQLIWFNYNPTLYSQSNFISFIITGFDGNVNEFKKICNTVEKIPRLSCNTKVNINSNHGVKKWYVQLQSGGGVLNLTVAGLTNSDKFEIWHNGIRVATSGMTVANGGPFDISNDSSNHPSADQYISTEKGTIPTRESEFEVENGFNQNCQLEQLLWFNYTALDATNDNKAYIVVTSVDGEYEILLNCLT